MVFCYIGDESEYVGIIRKYIPSSEIIQSPIGLNGGKARIMSIEGVVCCATKIFGDNITEEDGPDFVLDGYSKSDNTLYNPISLIA